MTAPRVRTRIPFLTLLAACAGVLGSVVSAHAAAQVNKFSIVLSAIPSSINAKDFNESVIDRVNETLIVPHGEEPLDKIGFAWSWDAQARYFLRPNFAIESGVSQIRKVTKREYLPAIGMSIEYRAEVLSVPVHAGAAYYLPPYNQGDFQARWYMGGGIMSLVFNRAKFSSSEANTDSAHTQGGNFRVTARRDSPGYYLETGVHMFFGGRYSVLLGGLYRSGMIRQVEGQLIRPTPFGPVVTPLGPVYDLDMSGIGGRMALAIGF